MDELVAYAEVSWGIWLANCPRPGCANAEHFGKHPDSGHVGGLTGTAFKCGTVPVGGCGLTCAAVWPDNVADIERLLLMRPIPSTRNWRPGETLNDLLAENIEHGVIPLAGLEEAGTETVFALDGGNRIAVDQLSGSTQRPSIGMGGQ